MAKIEEEKVESTSSHTTLRLFSYMKPYTKQMILCVVLVLLVTIFELLRPILIGDAIDMYIESYDQPYCIVEKSNLYFQGNYLSREQTSDQYAQVVLYNDQYYYFKNLTYTQSQQLLKETNYHVIDNQLKYQDVIGNKLTTNDLKVLRQNDFHGIVNIGMIYIVILILQFICSFLETWTMQQTGQSIIYTLREQLFHHVHSLPLRYFDTHPVGRIVTRLTNDVESLHEMYATILIRLFKNSIKIAGLAIVMISINKRLSFYAFLLVPLIVLLTYTFRTLSRKIHRIIRTKLSLLNTFLSENISGMRLIQIFVNEKEKYQEFKTKTQELYHSHMQQLAVFALFRPTIYFISQVALAILLYKGSQNVIDTTITIGTLYVFVNYVSNFFEPIQDLAEQFSTLQNALASAEKMFTVLDEENTILEKENPVLLDEIKGKIEFKNVWFAYEDNDYVLKDVSFKIEPGEKVAFVGATGAGKSSILNLIGRYYDIQKGEILIDDVNIKDLSISQLRSAIGNVQQDVFIFTGDIESNIKLSNDEVSDEIMKESAKTVNAAHFIEQLPHQYQEPVSERGSTLSAGQRQLLSFARTLAYDPQILVMDEATANIDTETELLIQDALDKLMKDRTTIMVAHRLSTIQHADHIIVMHKGRIREIGTHQELLQQNGIYKKLYELQLYAK